METSKVRMKIGDHEFEAEGSDEIVKAQLSAFMELISSVRPTETLAPKAYSPKLIEEKGDIDADSAVALNKILRVAGRIVSLTAIPASTEEAALLIMLGHKDLKNSESVTGQEIGDGLAQSGRPVLRTDRIMEKPIAEAHVLKSGFKRSTRYRLSNLGHQKALAVARELIASLP